jgi:hypothetical protein
MIQYHSFVPNARQCNDGSYYYIAIGPRDRAVFVECEGRSAAEIYPDAVVVAYFGANSGAHQSERYVRTADVPPAVATQLGWLAACHAKPGEFRWVIPASELIKLGLEPDWA